MKRIIAFALALVMLLALTGCGKSQAVKDAEAAISEIGEVTADSGEQIAKAEKLYGILTDSEKGEVENRMALVEAREEFDTLKKEAVYNNAKEAYEELNNAAALCIDGMDDIYGAWHFEIYQLSDHKNYQDFLYWDLAEKTPHLSSTELEQAANDLGFSAKLVASDWQYCLYITEMALTNKGVYAQVDENLTKAQQILQTLTETYEDYEYYPKLKEYYAKVSSYAEFFKAPSGSFKQLADTINDYENNIRTYQTDVGFLFDRK